MCPCAIDIWLVGYRVSDCGHELPPSESQGEQAVVEPIHPSLDLVGSAECHADNS